MNVGWLVGGGLLGGSLKQDRIRQPLVKLTATWNNRDQILGEI